jgi:hypothetical protein
MTSPCSGESLAKEWRTSSRLKNGSGEVQGFLAEHPGAFDPNEIRILVAAFDAVVARRHHISGLFRFALARTWPASACCDFPQASLTNSANFFRA